MRLDYNWTKENALVSTYDEDETSQTPNTSSDGCEDNGIDFETIVMIHESKYIIVHENLYSRICINIGGGHFGHLFVALACPLICHYLEHQYFCTC